MADDFYTVLGCERDVCDAALLRAYRAAVRRCHPDLHPANGRALSQFLRVQAAFEVLSDPARRQAYDASLARSRGRHRHGADHYRPPSAQPSNLEALLFSRAASCGYWRRAMVRVESEDEAIRKVRLGTYASLVAAYLAVAVTLASAMLGF